MLETTNGLAETTLEMDLADLRAALTKRGDDAADIERLVPAYSDARAKLVAYGRDRAEAIARMQRALDLFIVEGIHTSIPLHQRILADAEFQAANIDMQYVQRFFERAKATETIPAGA